MLKEKEKENTLLIDEEENIIPTSLSEIRELIRNAKNNYPSIGYNTGPNGNYDIFYERIIKYNTIDYMINLENKDAKEISKKLRYEESSADDTSTLYGIRSQPKISNIVEDLKKLLEDKKKFASLISHYASQMEMKKNNFFNENIKTIALIIIKLATGNNINSNEKMKFLVSFIFFIINV